MGPKLEFADHIVSHILSWPVAVFSLGIFYRQRLLELIGKLEKLMVKHGDTTLEATIASPANQLQKARAPELTSGALSKVSDQASDDIVKNRKAALDLGKGLPIVEVREEDIRDSLERLRFGSDEAETTEVLIRNLALFQWIAFSERTYRIIFGSQISLLNYIDQNGSQPENRVRAMYAEAAAGNPEFYLTFDYLNWLGFLIGQNLLLRFEGTLIGITNNGKGFLLYMTMESLNESRHF